jgi:glycosyltransferase involved in cell wall biosynthesis
MSEFPNHQPLVSAIIPTYNRESVIANAVESVLRQTYKNVEIIVVDDGSTDSTESRLARYRDRIQLVSQKNQGPAAARNRGIETARGEIVAFLDSDDLWDPRKLERQVAVLERAGKSVVCCLCNATLRSDKGEDTESFAVAEIFPPFDEGLWLNPAEVLATRFVFFNQAVAVRKWALDQVGGFDESLWLLEDWDLAVRLSFLGPWSFIREPLAIWNPNGSESLVAKAQKDPVSLKESALRIHKRALREMPAAFCGKLARLHSQKLKSTERELAALRLSQNSRAGAATTSKALQAVEHYRRALLKRTPLFPRMRVAAIPRRRAAAQAC